MESLFQSLVGLIVIGVGLLGTVLFIETLNAANISTVNNNVQELIIQNIHLWYSLQAPPIVASIAAAVLGILVAFIFLGIEIRDINRSRRSHNILTKPLAPKLLMERTHGYFYGEITITVVIPAHNEEKNIEATIKSLESQNRQPDRVVVVADNCTDKTVDIAHSLGIGVIKSVDNKFKKAGALNQALTHLLETAGPNDTFMIMDADTRLKPKFLEVAAKKFEEDRGLSAIGGLFFGEPGHGLLGQIQRNEFFRYQREINRRKGRIFVLTGTASIFRSTALATLASNRGKLVPGKSGDVYDTSALTEDNEITIALKSLGALMTSPEECQVETELMPTLAQLWRQRLRWQRGALENIGAYGITSTTTKYWSQQLGIAYSTFALYAYFLLIAIQIFASPKWIWYPFWIVAGIVFITERVVTVWEGGWRARFLAFWLIPELLYDSFLDVVFIKGAADIVFHRKAQWGHEVLDAKISGQTQDRESSI